MNKALKGLIWSGLILLTLKANSQTIGDYRTISGGNWNSPGIWQTFTVSGWTGAGSAPGSANGVITIGDGHHVTINSGTITTDQTIIESGGILTVDGSGRLNSNTDAGVVFNSGAIFNCSVDIGGIGSFDVLTGAIFNMLNGIVLRDNCTLNNYGTWNWTGSNNFGMASATVNNYGTFNINTDAAIFTSNYDDGTFNNKPSGIINKTGSPGNETIFYSRTNFFNAGTINVNSGKLNIGCYIGNSGLLNIATGATLRFTGNNAADLNAGTVLSGAGNINMEKLYSGSRDFSFNVNVNTPLVSSNLTINLSSGYIGGSSTLTLNPGAAFNWTDGVLAGNLVLINNTNNFTISGSGLHGMGDASTFTNNGTTTWTGSGNLSSYLNSQLNTINNNGIFFINTDADIFGGNQNYLVLNNNSTGVINKSGSNGDPTFISGPFFTFNNTGTFNINSGKVIFGGTCNLFGNVSIAASSTITFGSGVIATLNSTTDISGTGGIIITGANPVLQLNSNVNISGLTITYDADNATINGAKLTVENGIFNWAAGKLSCSGLDISTTSTFNTMLPVLSTTNERYLLGSHIITNYGTWNWTSGNISSTNQSVVEIRNYGTWNITGCVPHNINIGNFSTCTVFNIDPGVMNITGPLTMNSNGLTFIAGGKINVSGCGSFITPDYITCFFSTNPLCKGSSFSIPYNSITTYNPGNIFTVQLSDSTGSFTAPVSIGSLNSNSVSGNISATIPANAFSGTRYRVRVISSNPIKPGLDNGSDIVVKNLSTYYADIDNDGFGNAAVTTTLCSDTPPFGFVGNDDDCNDTLAAINPNATEILCNNIDDNCNGTIDEGSISGCMDITACNFDPNATCDNGSCSYGTEWYADKDGDTFGDGADFTIACTQPTGYVANDDDCNDTNAAIHPNGIETCNGIDDDCDGQVDEGLLITFYRDADGDGYGSSLSLSLCSAIGYFRALVDGDCNDANAAVNPGATEICNGLDDNCDGQVDEGFTLITYYSDADHDGFGISDSIVTCESSGIFTALISGDCHDENPAIHPNVIETCNGLDDNCDGQIDEGVLTTFYLDLDGDGYGISASLSLCEASGTYSALVDGDCNDANPAIYPGATEICTNGKDDNCDGQIDEGVRTTFYWDEDGDGYGIPNSFGACEPFDHYTALVVGDCNDTNAAIHPGAIDICNGLNDDCTGEIDEGLTTIFYFDEDGDGYGTDFWQRLCSATGNFRALVPGDCDDTNAAVNPAGTEICNGLDDDCDGRIDEDLYTFYYFDADGDGYGRTDVALFQCAATGNYNALVAGDCNDEDTAINPAATEICNGVDDDCDGLTDENIVCDHDNDGDGFVSGQDCNDNNPAIHPNATEICNDIDDDCDGQTDEGLLKTFYLDADGDGFGTSASQDLCVATGNFRALISGDCDDANDAVNPAAIESCNSIDDDCDGLVDEGLIFKTYYVDGDHDGFGTSVSQLLCAPVGNFTALVSGDCNDSSPAINPNASETINSIDDNCNGIIDDACQMVDVVIVFDESGSVSASSFQAQKNFALNFINSLPFGTTKTEVGVISFATEARTIVPISPIKTLVSNTITGFSRTTNNSCSCVGCGLEASRSMNSNRPGVKKIVLLFTNGVGSFCNGNGGGGGGGGSNESTLILAQNLNNSGTSIFVVASETTATLDAAEFTNFANQAASSIPGTQTVFPDLQSDSPLFLSYYTPFANMPRTFYKDADGDGFGDNNVSIQSCSLPAGYVINNTDCNDVSSSINPTILELCNGIDDDCDGQIDEGVKSTFYRDADADGYGDPAVTTQACTVPSGYVVNNDDCNDNASAVHPGPLMPAGTKFLLKLDGNTVDASGNNINGTNNNVSFGNDRYGIGNGAAYFNGTTSFISIADRLALRQSSFTISLWLNMSQPGSTWETLIDKNGGTGYTPTYNMFIGNQASQAGAEWGNGVSFTGINTSLSYSNQWVNMVWTFDDANNLSRIYLNGTLRNSVTTASVIPFSTASLFIGKGTSTGFFEGYLDDVMLIDRPLSPAEILNLYQKALIFPEICNGTDDNCNAVIDEGVTSTFYRDADGDGYGNPALTIQACSLPGGYSIKNTDCDDNNSRTFPGASEICNGVDENCNGTVDEGVKILPQPVINGPATVCSGQTNVIFSTALLTNVIYNWVVPSGVTVISGQGTNTLKVKWGSKKGRLELITSSVCGKGTKGSLDVSLGACSAKTDGSGSADVTVPNSEILKVYPNPFTDLLNIEFILSEDSKVKLEIFNVEGQSLGVLFNGVVIRGEKQIVEYRPDKIANGMIFYRLEMEEKILHGKVMMVK